MTDTPGPRTTPPPRFWPARPADLVDPSLCPSCFRTLPGPVCAFCALDLRSARAGELLALGHAMLRTESDRQDVIASIRTETAARDATRTASARPVVPEPAEASPRTAPHGATPGRVPEQPAGGRWTPAAAAPFSTGPAPAASPSSAQPGDSHVVPPSAAAGQAAPRRSAGQILLLTAGVVLVSVFAVFFAVLAYVFASVELRSVLTAAASVIVLVIAWALRSRRLTGTAEGIAVIGVVLLLLDVWIIRINRLFDVDRLDAWLYTGLALGVLAVVLAATSRLTGLRAGSLSAAAVAPVAVFALVVGATAAVAADATRALFGALAVVVVASVELLLSAPKAERATIRVASLVAGFIALITAGFSFPGIESGEIVGFTLAAAAWTVALLVAVRSAPVLRGRAWPVLGAIGLAGAGTGLVLTSAEALGSAPSDHASWRPVLFLVLVCVVSAFVRSGGPGLRRSMGLLGILLASLAAVTATALVGVVVTGLVEALSAPWFRAAPVEGVGDGTGGPIAPSLGLAVTALLVSLALRIIGSATLLARSAWVPVVIAAVAVAGAALLPSATLVSLVILVVSAGISLGVATLRGLVVAARCAAFGASIALALLAAALAPTSSAVWPATVVVVVLVLAGARLLTARRLLPASTISGIIASTTGTVVLLGAGAVIPSWTRVGGMPWGPVPDGAGVALVGAAILLVLPVMINRLPGVETVIVGVIAAVSSLSAWAAVSILDGGVDDRGWRISITAALLAAAIAWSVRPRGRAPRIVGVTASIPLGASLAAELVAFVESLALADGDSTTGRGAIAAAAFLAGASAIAVVRAHRASQPPRGVERALDLSIFSTVVIVLASAVATGGSIAPLVLLVLSVAPTLIAFRPDGGGYPRRHLAWAGAVLAVAALWWFLIDHSVDVVEYYSLPVAGLLLGIASISALNRRPYVNRPPVAAVRLLGTEAVLAAAAVVGVVPSALQAGGGEAVRFVVVIAVGIGLLSLALLVLRDSAVLRGRTIAWSAAVAAVSLPVAARMLSGETVVVSSSWDALQVALGIGTAALLLAASAVVRIRPSAVLACVATTASSAMVLITVGGLLNRGTMSATAAVPWLIVLSATAAVASTRRGRPAVVAAITSAASSVVLGAAMISGVPHPEYVSLPLGIAATASGALRLVRDPAARSWPVLAPGLLLILLPSLALDLGDTELWRVIGVGVAAVATLLVGVSRRLQAPLVIGGLVVIAHGLAQIWPWISALYDAGYWWLWAGIGGVVLIVFAARYEQRVQNLREARLALTALR